MTKPRRNFTDEFKREAVALLASSGRPLMQIAEELGIQPSMLRRWRTAAGVPAGASRRPDTQATPPQAGGVSGDQSIEIARLRREVERLRMERDILKKTVAIFLEPPK
jgi:transposase